MVSFNFKCSCPPGPISPVIDASGQVIIAVVPPGIVKEISPGAETMAVNHASWSLGDTEIFKFCLKFTTCEKVHMRQYFLTS